MAVNVSTGFATALLGGTPMATLMEYGVIEIRSGTQPAAADMAPTGTALARITRDGGAWTAGNTANGLQFLLNGRAVIKNPEHTWVIDGFNTGTAGWFRWLPNPADPGTDSTTAVRIDGAMGVLNAIGDYQLFLPSLAITPGTSIVLDDWWYAIPPLGVF